MVFLQRGARDDEPGQESQAGSGQPVPGQEVQAGASGLETITRA